MHVGDHKMVSYYTTIQMVSYYQAMEMGCNLLRKQLLEHKNPNSTQERRIGRIMLEQHLVCANVSSPLLHSIQEFRHTNLDAMLLIE